jgi:hypothetical protein
MATKWSAVSISGYGDNSPADDGTATEANKVKYSTIKTDLTNPLNTALSSALTGLTEAFNDGTVAKSGTYSTTATDHARTIECTSTFTLSLLAAATAGAGYRVTVKNAGTGLITVARSSTDTIDGATSYVLNPKEGATFVVNAAGNGYVIAQQAGLGLELIAAGTSTSVTEVVFTGLSAIYSSYLLVAHNILPATDNVSLHLAVSADGGSTYETTYRHVRVAGSVSGSATVSGDNSGAQIVIAGGIGNDAAAGEEARIALWLHDPAGTVDQTSCEWQVGYRAQSTNFTAANGAGHMTTTKAHNAFKLYWSSGDFTSITYALYGLRD